MLSRTLLPRFFGGCLNIATLCSLAQPLEAGVNWRSAVDLTVSNGDAVYPQVVAADDKNSLAVWSKFNGQNYVLQSSSAPFGSPWKQAVDISRGEGNAFFPRLILDYQDNPIVVWSQNLGASQKVQVAELAKKGWSYPLTLSASLDLNPVATKPQIASGDNGLTVVVWQNKQGNTHHIQAVTKLKNKGWSLPENVSWPSTEGFGDADPQVAVDPKGNALAVWVNVPTQTVQASYKSIALPWSAPVVLSNGGEKVSLPQVAFDSLGNAVVVWVQNNGVNRVIQGAFAGPNGSWSNPANLSSDGNDADNPQVAVDPAGNVIVVWQHSNGVNTLIQAATRLISKSGQKWVSPFDLSKPGEDASEPQVCINNQKNIAVIWKRSDGANFIIQSIYKKHGEAWSSPVSISSPGEDAAHPQITMTRSGNVVATWERTDGINNLIQAAFGKIQK